MTVSHLEWMKCAAHRASVCCLFIGTLLMPAVSAADNLNLLNKAIEAWRFTEARAVQGKLLADERAMPEAVYLEGKLLFYEGDCKGALMTLRKAIEGAKSEVAWKALRDRVEETDTVFSKLEVLRSAGGKFLFRFAQGPDAMLVPYAEEALEKQLAVLVSLFGDKPERPIEIDLLPDMASLSQTGGLSVEQMERTGTVGVTKYGRVMVVTPRKLVTGYPWIDTLAHELTHFFISRASWDRAPIWLHEGIAKLLENRWRSDVCQGLTPEEAYLLDRAVKEGRLIPLKRFHPSVAYLPDQEDAALAYAQVLSFTSYLNERLGPDWIKRTLRGLGNGYNLDYMLDELSRSNLKRHYHWWRQMAAGKRHTPVPAVGMLERRFKRGEVVESASRESTLSTEVRRHLRVGDLLRLRGHLKAAVDEFTQARKLAKSPSTEISDRLGGCLIELGDHQQVISILTPMVDLYPYHSTSHVQLGQALAAERRTLDAVRQLEWANAINPFHPDVHCMLAELHVQVKKTAAADREQAYCQLSRRFAGQELAADEN